MTFAYNALEFLALFFVFALGGAIVLAGLFYLIDRTQTGDAIRRNYPVIGRFRGLFTKLGEFFRDGLTPETLARLDHNNSDTVRRHTAFIMLASAVKFCDVCNAHHLLQSMCRCCQCCRHGLATDAQEHTIPMLSRLFRSGPSPGTFSDELVPWPVGQVLHALKRWSQEHQVQVERAEFLIFMLQELELVDCTELKNISKIFDAMDTDGNGVLTMADVHTMTMQRSSYRSASSHA